MIELLTIIGLSLLSIEVMWIGFVAIMHLRKIKEKWGLTVTQKIMGNPALVFFYVMDVTLRLTVFSILFLRVPKLETVSKLLEREAEGAGWRKHFAHYVREDMLADFDPSGSHGKPGRK